MASHLAEVVWQTSETQMVSSHRCLCPVGDGKERRGAAGSQGTRRRRQAYLAVRDYVTS